MGLETGTYISDLVVTNPITGDQISQGDNHIQLLKNVLQNTFPGANRAYPIPTGLAKTANYSVLAADQNKVIHVDCTAGAVTLTMPTLTSAEYGWQIQVVKFDSTTNPIFIAPPSGTIVSGPLSLTKTRRCMPGAPFTVLWTAGTWWCGRTIGTPVGGVIPFFGASLPVGFEWPNAQTLSSAANYPDYNSVRGGLTTPDLRSRTMYGSNLGVADVGRLGGILSPGTLESAGGAERNTLLASDLPSHTHSGTSAGESIGHTHTFSGTTAGQSVDHTHSLPTSSLTSGGVGGTAGPTGLLGTTAGGDTSGGTSQDHSHGFSGTTSDISVGHTHTLTTSSQSGSPGTTLVNNIGPAIVCNYLLVVE